MGLHNLEELKNDKWRALELKEGFSASRFYFGDSQLHEAIRSPQDRRRNHTRRHREPAAPPPASMSCYSATWEEFESSAQALYDLDPAGTRYTIQYKHGGHGAVMKVSDDKQVFKFRAPALEQWSRRRSR